MITMAWIVGIIVLLLILLLGGLAVFSARTARQVEKLLPAHGHFIEVDGARIHYLDEGSGPPLVLIHGLAGQTRVFTHSLLDRLKSEYRVIILDRPGSGYSTRARGASATINAQAQTIAHFIEALELKRPLIVGHSLGGAIALSLGLHHPEYVGGLALLAPLTHVEEEVPPLFRGLAIRSPLMRGLVGWTSAIPLSIRNRDFVLDMAFGPQPVAIDYGTRGGGLLNLRPHSYINASRDLMAAMEDLVHMQERYRHLTIPIGMLFGTGDRLLDHVKHGKALAAKIAELDLELIEGGGHMVPISSADRAVALIKRVAQRVAANAEPAPRLEMTET
ncbi:MAG: alpha/beta fold hydrolase [Xanthobacteraceae bacterium]